jgi:8-oxo-dGTP diphosphatase
MEFRPAESPRPTTVDVAVNILQAPDGRVLVAERTAGQISAGFWEFPGGKIDPGETPPDAARRELAEEVGLEALTLRPWIRYEHAFRTRVVRLWFFRVDSWRGTPHGREGQRIAWIDPAAPSVGPILPSLKRVLLALGLPPIYAVNAFERGIPTQSRLELMETAMRQGIRLFQIRDRTLAPDQRIGLARRAGELAKRFGARVLLTGSALECRRAGLSSLHSPAAELQRLSVRPPVDLWIASCHSEDDVLRAAQLGADAAVVSPILLTAAHPERPPIGWDGLKRLAAAAPLPLYAQGGIDLSHVAQAQAAGAIGIATARFTPGV